MSPICNCVCSPRGTHSNIVVVDSVMKLMNTWTVPSKWFLGRIDGRLWHSSSVSNLQLCLLSQCHNQEQHTNIKIGVVVLVLSVIVHSCWANGDQEGYTNLKNYASVAGAILVVDVVVAVIVVVRVVVLSEAVVAHPMPRPRDKGHTNLNNYASVARAVVVVVVVLLAFNQEGHKNLKKLCFSFCCNNSSMIC